MGKSTINVVFSIAMLNYQRDPEGMCRGSGWGCPRNGARVGARVSRGSEGMATGRCQKHGSIAGCRTNYRIVIRKLWMFETAKRNSVFFRSELERTPRSSVGWLGTIRRCRSFRFLEPTATSQSGYRGSRATATTSRSGVHPMPQTTTIWNILGIVLI